MRSSTEVRWFAPGLAPAGVERWFARATPHPKQEPSRTDRYFYLQRSDALGIKVRQGKLEHKVRQHQHGVFRFHQRVAGRIEQWHKWSFTLAEDDGTLAAIEGGDPHWIAVEKTRLLHKYGVTADRRAVAVPAEEQPAEGCLLELTRITVAGRTWWSLAFAAFGDGDTTRDNLLLVAAQVLVGDEVPRLSVAESYGYPHWMTVLA
jgi:hypothetical protein